MIEITRRRLMSTAALGMTALALPFGSNVQAQSREKTLRYVTPGSVNSLDPVALGATTESTALGSAIYDRLLRFGKKPDGDSFVYDFDDMQGELAESYDVSEDHRTFTFHIRKGATWHDGSPVTAGDVQWSLERAINAKTMSSAQMETGSIAADAVIEVIDPMTVKMTLAHADRLALPNLATLYAPMFNSTLVKANVTEADPWGVDWLKSNTAGGGAYTVERYMPGEQVVLARNENWINGRLPDMQRIILQTVPAAATRRNLVERGDADITTQLQAADIGSLEQSGHLKITSAPMPTAFVALIFNTQMAPFDNPLVREAIAAAVPYDDILTAAVLGRGGKLYGADWKDGPPSAKFPQPMPNGTDLDRARKALADAGYKDGFETTLSYGAYRAQWADIAAPLIQEALGRIGIKVRIEKLADAQFAEAVTKKTIPMMIERSLAFFPVADYFFRVFLSGEQRWNFSSWKNPRVDALLASARYEADPQKYDAMAKELISIMQKEKPMVMLWMPNLEVTMAPNLSGFTVWPMYYLDFRDIKRNA